MSEGGCECPVCEKQFDADTIQKHVLKCLFLNETSEAKDCNKRKAEGEPSSLDNTKSQRLDTSHQDDGESSDSDVQVEMPVGQKPLAEEVRPRTFDDYVGQETVLGPNSLLKRLILTNQMPSMILWGPPGCGKTTFATIIQHKCQSEGFYCFYKRSATNTGVSELKSLIELGRGEVNKPHQPPKKRMVLFLDEIHRFSKSQQAVLLSYIERGEVILIGATTENPSYSLTNSLLSRCKVVIFEKLDLDSVKSILLRAIKLRGHRISNVSQEESGEEKFNGLNIEMEAVTWLVEMCDGDARIALTGLEMAINLAAAMDMKEIKLQDIKEGVKKSHIFYEKKGDEHFHLVSALHKAIRACDDNGALYWLARLLEGGEDPIYIARRLVRASSEDVGMLDHMALSLAVSAMQACEHLKRQDSELVLAELVIYLARTGKSTEIYDALTAAKNLVNNNKGPLPPVPLHLRNATNKFTQQLGYGRGYNTEHRDFSNLTYMPLGLECVNFFKPNPDS